MKWMERVMTVNGPGLVVGQGEAGTVLVSIARRDLVGLVCRGPCVNVFMKEEAIIQQSTADSRADAVRPNGGSGGKNGRR